MAGVRLFFDVFVLLHFAQDLVSAESAVINGTTTKVEEKWFETYLDHFNVWNNRTFALRFFEVSEFFRKNGPLFVEIGAEATLDPDLLKSYTSYELAQKLHAQIVFLEHRYYGQSVPFENATTEEDYTFLTVEQALEDLAYFVDTYKKLNPSLKNSKVAVFGCSYGGSLATWFRYKFPHLVDAAWASSAPLRMKQDFHEYYETAGEVYSNVSSECIAIIRQGYREAKKLMSTPEGLEEARTVFEGWECGNVTEMNETSILATIRLAVSDQYSSPNHATESCKFLQSKNASTTCFQQLSAFVLWKSEDVCVYDSPEDDLGWIYQTCTAFGFSFTTHSLNQPFKDNYDAIEADLESCAETFSDNFDWQIAQRGIDRMNRVYGSINLPVTKVLNVHGVNDPWRKLGLYYQKNDDNPVILIPNASHCSDQTDYGEKPAPQVKEARRKGMEIMAKWLQ